MTSFSTGFAYLDAVRDEPGAVLAFAHRGGATHPDLRGLENTLVAFAHAVELGYSYLETDVHTTVDGALVAFHDAVLDRVTDARGAVADLTLEELRRARIGGRERIPTLAELFDAFPDVRINIDLKSRAAAPALAQFIAERDAWDRVLVGSFSRRNLQHFRRLTRGRVPTSASPLEAVAFLLLPSGRLAARLTGGHVTALQIPHVHRGLPITTAGLIRRAHAVGVHVHVWTIDEPEEMLQLIARGVDGLMTDRTDILKLVLVEHGHWRGAP